MCIDSLLVETLSGDNRVAEIYYDTDLESPRVESDNAGTMVCWHSSYDLGDANPWNTPSDFLNWAAHTPMVILPLYLHDHSGLAISTRPFSSVWDSMPIGWIFVVKEDAEIIVGSTDEPTIRRRLEQEVQTYNQYLAGDVYFVKVEEIERCECCHGAQPATTIEAVGGVYGLNHALDLAADYVPVTGGKE